MQLRHSCSELSTAVLTTRCVLSSVACAWVAGTDYSQTEGGVGMEGRRYTQIIFYILAVSTGRKKFLVSRLMFLNFTNG